MESCNMLEAKSNLSRLVEMVESGTRPEIVIARNGRPAARLVPVRIAPGQRIGVAKGKFVVPDVMDEHEAEILAMFGGAAA